MLIDVPNSAVALAIAGVAREKDKAYINTNAATSALTGPNCNAPDTIHWSYDTYMLSHSTGGAMVAAGGKSWFFITANYAFGQLLRDQTTAVVKAAGGTVVRRRRLPVSADHRLLLLPGAGAILRRPGAGSRQRRQGHRQLDQAGPPVRHYPERHEDRRPADLPQRRPRHGPGDRPGSRAHRELLLEHERPDARLHQARVDQVADQLPLDGPGRLLQRCHPLHEGGRCDRPRCGQQERRRNRGHADEEDADQTTTPTAIARSARTAASCAPPTCSR